MCNYYMKVMRDEAIPKGVRVRGHNIRCEVYTLGKYGFNYIGCQTENTASYKGDYGMGVDVLHREKGYRTDKGGYHLIRKDIKLRYLP